MMDRRRFLLTAMAGALATPLAAGGQEAGKVWRVGHLSTGSISSGRPLNKVFQEQLRELGYIDGQNVVFTFRGADGNNDRLPALADELVRLRVDILVTAGTPAAVAAKQATSMIPIVTAIVADPVGAGLVTSLARPGGNVTGIANLDDELTGKRLALLNDAVPGLSRVAIMWKTGNPAHKTALREAEVVARARDLKLQPVDVRGPGEFQSAFANIARARVGALIVTADSMFNVHRTQLTDFAAKSRLPTMFWRRDFVAAGGLMSYGTIYSDLFRRAAVYVDRIAKGAKPADLPMEQATKFELVINLKTAKALGLTIPPSLLARADQIIDP
jgi:putative tryptophan/tyrosine transport system substrate-binding protein